MDAKKIGPLGPYESIISASSGLMRTRKATLLHSAVSLERDSSRRNQQDRAFNQPSEHPEDSEASSAILNDSQSEESQPPTNQHRIDMVA